MLGIVIPLKSSKTSSCWFTTSNNLIQTLRSVLNQSSKNFCFIIVGHEIPFGIENIDKSGDSFYSVINELPSPPKVHSTQEQFTLDKNSKIAKGIEVLKKREPAIVSWFVLDADDLIDTDFVESIEQSLPFSLFTIDKGFLFYTKSNRVVYNEELTQYCGSTAVIDDSALKFDEKGRLLSCPFLSQSHMGIKNYFKSMQGAIIKKAMTPLVMYSLGHGQNISDGYRNRLEKIISIIKPLIKGRKITKEIQIRYGLFR